MIVACGAVALLAAIYLDVRSPRPRADLPGAPTPSEPAVAVVTAPASVEPAGAQAPPAEQGTSFRELRKCIYAYRELVAAKHLLDCRIYEGKPQYQEAFAACLEGPMDARNRLTAAEER